VTGIDSQDVSVEAPRDAVLVARGDRAVPQQLDVGDRQTLRRGTYRIGSKTWGFRSELAKEARCRWSIHVVAEQQAR
jgi:hypothetical protein